MNNQQANNKKRNIVITATAVILLGAGGLWAANQAQTGQQTAHSASYQNKMHQPKKPKGKKKKGTVNAIIDEAMGNHASSKADQTSKSVMDQLLDSNPLAVVAKALETSTTKASLAAATAAIEHPKALNSGDDKASVQPLANDDKNDSQPGNGGGQTPVPVNPVQPIVPDNPNKPVNPVDPVNPVQPNHDERPVLETPGNVSVPINHGGTFNFMNFVRATDKEDGDLTSAIKVSGHVDLNKAGDYVLIYSVTDSAGQTTSVKRTVTVFNDLPVISAEDQKVEAGTVFDPSAHVSASDAQDGDLTSAIKVSGQVDTAKLGTYKIDYRVTDQDGGQVTKTIVVTVFAKDATFSGLDPLTVKQGSVPDLRQGVSVSDPYDSKPANFTVSPCDTATIGKKTVTYSYIDKWGHVTKKNRIVNVVAEKPVFRGLQDRTIKVGATFDPMAGVTATSANGPVTISYIGEVNTEKAGRYTLTYTAVDQSGQKTQKTIVITVE